MPQMTIITTNACVVNKLPLGDYILNIEQTCSKATNGPFHARPQIMTKQNLAGGKFRQTTIEIAVYT